MDKAFTFMEQLFAFLVYCIQAVVNLEFEQGFHVVFMYQHIMIKNVLFLSSINNFSIPSSIIR